MSAHKALGLVTWNVADVLGMKSGGRIVVGQRADLLGYNYDPIEGYAKMGGLYSHLKLIVNGQNVECNPRQV